MHHIGVWWRQPDHYEWLSDYLAVRRLKPVVRLLLFVTLMILAASTLLMLFSPSGPQGPLQRGCAVASIAGMGGMALMWLVSWPTRVQSQILSALGTLGIGVVCLIQSDPQAGMSACAAFGGLAGYVAFFHAARPLVATLGVAFGTAAMCAARIGNAGDVRTATASFLLLAVGILSVPVCIQILVHWLSIDARKSSTDPLTGLRNRRGFYRSTSEMLVADPPPLFLSVLMIDLDNFKYINDAHGHATGDRILIAVADSLRQSDGHGTVIARVGGEEFLVAQVTAIAEALTTAEAMRHAIAATHEGVTASIGISSIRLAAGVDGTARQTLDRLVQAADSAMYEAKSAGGNQFRHCKLSDG